MGKNEENEDTRIWKIWGSRIWKIWGSRIIELKIEDLSLNSKIKLQKTRNLGNEMLIENDCLKAS